MGEVRNMYPNRIVLPNLAAYVPEAARPPLWRVLHSYEGGIESCGGMSGCPEVLQVQPSHYSWLNEEFQRYWFWGNSVDPAHPTAKELQAWGAYTAGGSADDLTGGVPAFLTDRHGTDLFRDYVRNENIGEVDPQIQCIVCGGNVVTGYEYTHTSGQRRLALSVLNWASGPDYNIKPSTHPWYWMHATNMVVGRSVVNPFTQLGGRNTGLPVVYPLIGRPNLGLYIPMKYLARVGDNEPIPNPYDPVFYFMVLK